MKIEKDVHVAMRDGVKVAVDIFRPDEEGKKFPALLAMSAYGKGVQTIKMPSQPPGTPLYLPPIEAGNPDYYVSNGYAHVIADSRGTGKSEGEYLGWLSRKEAEDGYDLVEWIAGQPWCDGNVGMAGISYFGTIQLQVAAEQPPHLKAIMPWNGVADYYREATHHGGMLQTFFLYLYHQRAARKNFVSVASKEMPAEKLEELCERLKSDSDYAMYPELYNIIDNPGMVPNFFDLIVHETDGPFYWERSPYTVFDKIRIPFYARSGWWSYAHQHLVSAFWCYNGIDAPKKLQIDKPIVEDRPMNEEYNKEVIRWYDHWLKGKDTGIMKEPPIELYVMGKNDWRYEQEWPLARTKWTKAYLKTRGLLQLETQDAPGRELSYRPDDAPGRPDVFVQQPLTETTKVQSATYLTMPLRTSLEATGPMALYFYASIDQEDTNWMVSLRDVAPDDSETELSKGFLKASHRALDQKRTKPWEPFHTHTKPEPVTPGQIYEYAIAMAPTSNIFPANHRIKLDIFSMDHSMARDWKAAPPTIGMSHYPWHVCSRKTTVHRIYHDGGFPSHLLLPIIPPGK